MVVLWEEFTGAADPLAVHIGAHKTASVIANDDSIRILHGNNFEHKCISEQFGLGIFADQEIDHAIHHPTRIGFSWVNSGSEYRRFSNGYILRIRGEISDDQHVNIITSEGLA